MKKSKEFNRFNFKTHETIRETYVGCHVGVGVYVSGKMLDRMGRPKFIEVAYDEKNKAILLTGKDVQERDIYKVSMTREKELNYPHSGGAIGVTKLNEIIPKGRYILQGEVNDGYICILQ